MITSQFIYASAAMVGFVTASAALAAPAGDCSLFTTPAGDGAGLHASLGDEHPFLPVLPAELTGKVSSIWLKNGVRLEAYGAPDFKGELKVFDQDSPGARAENGGVLISIAGTSFASQLASFRCRSTGVVIQTQAGALTWFEGARFYWFSGGNHYNQRWLEMHHGQDGHAVLTAHADDTYGINRQDYVIDLTSGDVTVTYRSYMDLKGSVQFQLGLARFRPELQATVTSLTKDLAVIAAGYNYDGRNRVSPPAPELNDVIAYLSHVVGSPEG